MIYLSPTEHDLRTLLAPHSPTTSSLCESNGVDVIITTNRGLVGYQRKTLSDLFASLGDGRLALELGQITTSSILAYAYIILEHDPSRVTTDGQSYLDAPFTVTQLRNLTLKCILNSVPVLSSLNLADTCDVLLSSSGYIASDRAALFSRPKPSTDTWGRRGNREWGIHILQSFPGIGPKTAAAIYDTYGIPIDWTITQEELRAIPGIGAKRAGVLMKALE